MAQPIAKLYAEIGADTTKLQAGLTQSKSKLQGFKSNLNDTVKGMTGFSAASLVSVGAVYKLVDGVRAGIDETHKYNLEMMQFARITGVGVEETSRMVQWTDDLGLEMGSLEAAARGAALKGVSLTTENLARMSEEYLKLAPGTERNTYLIDKFGRSGLEMARVLEAGSKKINELSGAVSKNLIVTEEAAKASEEYRVALDELNDATTGLKMSVGNKLIPVLSEAAKTLGLLVTWDEKVAAAHEEHNKAIIMLYDSYGDYYNEVLRSYGGIEKLRAEDLIDMQDKGIILSKELWEQRRAYGLNEEALQKFAQNSPGYWDEIAQDANIVPLLTEDNNWLENLKASMASLAVASQGYWDQIAQDAESSVPALQEAVGYFNSLYSKEVWIKIHTQHMNEYITGQRSYQEANLEEQRRYMGHATGGSWKIPPGYSNDSFPLGALGYAQSGETVTITPKGQTAANVTINVNGYNRDAVELAHQISRVIQRAR